MEVEFTISTKYGTVFSGIRDLKICGDIVFRLASYIENSPGTTGPTAEVSFYFLDQPDIFFNFTGHAKVLNSIGLKGIISSAIGKVVSAKMVLPNSVTQFISITDFKLYPLLFQSSTPVGLLRATLQEANISVIAEAPEVKSSRSKGVFVFLMKLKRRFLNAAEEVSESMDDLMAAITGVNTDPYLKLTVGDKIWTPTGKMLGSTFNFTVFDPEQCLYISAWDKDCASGDDMLGLQEPYTLAEALDASEKELGIHGAEGELFGRIRLKFEWLLATPGVLSPGGCVVLIFSVTELCQEGDAMKGRQLAVRAKYKGEEQVTHWGKHHQIDSEKPLVVNALTEVRKNLTEANIDETTIDQVLTLKCGPRRIAINTSFHFNISTTDLDSEVLEFSLIELGQPSNDKKRKVEAVASQTYNLSGLKSKPHLHEPGPVIFNTPYGDVSAGIMLDLAGLTVPGESQVPVRDENVYCI
jgi:hypothetical protein